MFKKSVDLITRNIKNLEKTKKASSYIGKTVYSKKGEIIGRVYDIVLKNEHLVGILVKGKRKIFIGKEFFGSESKKGMVLKIEPVTSIIGKQVFDSHGKKIGKVSALKRKSNTNAYSGIMVKKSIYKRAFEIPKKEIDIAKKSVLLKSKKSSSRKKRKSTKGKKKSRTKSRK